MPTLPSWLKPADPASFAAEGMRIGASEAAEANAAAEHAAASQRAQQQLQMRQQVLEAQATAAAQKHVAQQGYQQALAQGVDPTQAILKFGPMMGAGAAVGSALTAQRLAAKPAPAAPAIQMMPGPNGTQIPVLVQGGRGTVIPRSAFTAPKTPAAPLWVPESEETGPAHWNTGSGGVTPAKAPAPDISPSERAQTLRELDTEQKAILTDNPMLLNKARTPKLLTDDDRSNLSRLQEIDDQRKTLLPRLGTPSNVPHGTSPAAPAGGGNKVFNYDPDSGKLVPQGGGASAAPPAAAPALPKPAQIAAPPAAKVLPPVPGIYAPTAPADRSSVAAKAAEGMRQRSLASNAKQQQQAKAAKDARIAELTDRLKGATPKERGGDYYKQNYAELQQLLNP